MRGSGELANDPSERNKLLKELAVKIWKGAACAILGRKKQGEIQPLNFEMKSYEMIDVAFHSSNSPNRTGILTSHRLHQALAEWKKRRLKYT